jgi:hypothetical protein
MKSITIPIGLAAILAALAGCSGDIGEGDGSSGNGGVSGASGAVDPGDIGSAELSQATEAPAWSIVRVSSIGKGCPLGSTTTSITPDRTTFTVAFSDMVLESKPSATFQRLGCVVGVTLHVPNGWSVATGTIDTRGYAHLESGALGEQNSTYSFAGRPVLRAYRTPMKGPFEGQYSFTDDLKLEGLIWSACGVDAILNINAGIQLDTKKSVPGTSYIDTAEVDGRFQKVVHLQFRKCPI